MAAKLEDHTGIIDGQIPLISSEEITQVAGGADGAKEVVMSKVVLDVSMSLDGFIAGPIVREAEPMGDGGEHLHAWMAGNGPDAQLGRLALYVATLIRKGR
jgi:hypothetical protein